MKKATLDDRYDLARSRIFVTGSQAVIRLALMQHALDARAGLNTAGYISGYRGSPLGSLDQQLTGAKGFLEASSILFRPGLNEDLAATAIWGTQQAELRGEGKYDGVFGIWYGKGPGVDRSGDAFRHANHAGTSKTGGVIALMGDDHTCESSTSAHQSEFAFVDAMMPVLNPAGVQEILDYGLAGIALSRFAGVWTGIKCVKDNIEQSASIEAALDRPGFIIPDEFRMPPGGLNIRLGDGALEKESRLHIHKRPATLAFIRANKLDRILLRGGREAHIGIITTGKSYLDVAEALDLLGIDEVRAAKLGLRLYKVGAVWPLEPEGLSEFASGLRTIMVVEEKRSLIETQVKEQLYNRSNPPVVIGKRDESDKTLFPAYGALEPVQIALAIGERLIASGAGENLAERMDSLKRAARAASNVPQIASRIAYFCAGCPHNTSTVVPEGARAYAGIGCHYMAQWMGRNTEGFTHMGGEGANWIGEAPFSKREHIYQNLGDGTYIHSGSLAVRAAVAAGTRMTFKLLYNDAVAMTGGQSLDGGLTVPQLARQLAAEGVSRIAVVAEDPGHYPADASFPQGTRIEPRNKLDDVQKSLAQSEGVSVLIFDQTCAAEKRRRRKRGAYPDPDQRVFINELVCEGCGDCGVQSNCVAIVPLETEFGRKRAIDQSACNKDFSCLKGFCPSFVTVHGGELRGAQAQETPRAPAPEELPLPAMPALDRTRSIVITGVGGTGVVTVGALLGMAAHLEGKGAAVIDMSGLAQKGGAVAVHIRIAEKPQQIKAIRASAAGADLVIGCDLVVTASDKILGIVREGVTTLVVNSHEMMTGEFTRDPDAELPAEEMRLALQARAGAEATHFVEATRTASVLTGDSIAANMYMLGYAWQLGHIPLALDAIFEAIRLNQVQVERNIAAFQWGRMSAHDPEAIAVAVGSLDVPSDEERISRTLEDVIERRAVFLTAYQDAAYAARYRARVEAIQSIENKEAPGETALAEAVARGLFKLMTYKDEYEVARLYTDGSFAQKLAKRFTGNFRLEYHLAPPFLGGIDPATGRPAKRRFGSWIVPLFRLLARLKRLRGTALDPFGYGEERRLERQLIADYEADLELIRDGIDAGTHGRAVELARLPQTIRGFGPVKRASISAAAARREQLRAAFRGAEVKSRRAA